MTNIRGLIGVVHLLPLPGDPRPDAAESFAAVITRALADARALADGGVDAILVENFGSAPFVKGTRGRRLAPHAVATLALAAGRIREDTRRPVGVNCLRNDARAAIGIAAATGLDFVRVNVHTGAYLTDQGIIEGEADRTLRYRARLGARSVAILADVLVKHARPLADLSLAAAARDALGRGLADGVVVTGSATGEAPDRAAVEEALTAAGGSPVFVGSGLTPANAELARGAAGAIVGTWCKSDGRQGPVAAGRVRDLVSALRGVFR